MHISPFASSIVLVTGASGFLGAVLCRLLASYGAEVPGVSRSPRETTPGVSRWWQGTFSDFEFVRRIVEELRPSHVFHLAGSVTGVRDLSAVGPTFSANLTSTVNLLTAMAEQKTGRLTMAGSLEEPADGSQPPSSPYAASKGAAYAYAQMFQSLYGIPIVVPRVFITYGPGQDDRNKLIPYVVSSLLRGESPKLSSGTRPIDWVHVNDVAEGLAAAALSENVTDRVDLGSGTLVTTRALVEKIAAMIPSAGKPLFGALPDRPMEQIRVADVEKTAAAIGWRPRISLDEGLGETIAWLRTRFS